MLVQNSWKLCFPSKWRFGAKLFETTLVTLNPNFLLSCLNYSDERSILLSKTRNINPNILGNTNSQITQFFLYQEKNFTASTNFIILNSTMEHMLATKWYETNPSVMISISYIFLLIDDFRHYFSVDKTFSIFSFFLLWFLPFTLSPSYDSKWWL